MDSVLQSTLLYLNANTIIRLAKRTTRHVIAKIRNRSFIMILIPGVLNFNLKFYARQLLDYSTGIPQGAMSLSFQCALLGIEPFLEKANFRTATIVTVTHHLEDGNLDKRRNLHRYPARITTRQCHPIS